MGSALGRGFGPDVITHHLVDFHQSLIFSIFLEKRPESDQKLNVFEILSLLPMKFKGLLAKISKRNLLSLLLEGFLSFRLGDHLR